MTIYDGKNIAIIDCLEKKFDFKKVFKFLNNKRKTFKDSWKGYMMCGTSTCSCWKDNQSKKVSDAKNSLSDIEWSNIIDKRKKTNLKKNLSS